MAIKVRQARITIASMQYLPKFSLLFDTADTNLRAFRGWNLFGHVSHIDSVVFNAYHPFSAIFLPAR